MSTRSSPITTSSSENRKLKTENSPARPRRPWTPTDTDHLIYRWVKMEGETQGWVADQFGISQATVSRIVERYERWQAHAAERENGRLDHTERLRAQRWLTFQRNEQIVTSCLRLAGALEGFVDSSRSTTQHPAKLPSQDQIVRTQHFTIDRTASASRFLRLAYRINMDQLKLAQLDPPPPANPLTPEELAAEEAAAAADAQELHAARERAAERRAAHKQELDDQESIPATPASPTPTRCVSDHSAPGPSEISDLKSQIPSAHLKTENRKLKTASLDLEPETRNLNPETSHSPMNILHNLHTANPEKIAPTSTEPTTSPSPPPPPKKSRRSRITNSQWPAAGAPLTPIAPKNGRQPHPRQAPSELAIPPTRRVRKKPR